MLCRIKALLIVIFIIDVYTFYPSILGVIGAGFLWDDPNVKAGNWTGLLRLVLTFLLFEGPCCIASNLVLAGRSLRYQSRPTVLTWVTFLPSLLVAGVIVYFDVDDLQDRMQTRRVKRSYEEIVAASQMEQFHLLTKDLSPLCKIGTRTPHATAP